MDTIFGLLNWLLNSQNIRVLAKYYTAISVTRMAELLDWPVEKTEQFVCTLVTNGVIADARIDRLDGVVRFAPSPSPLAVLGTCTKRGEKRQKRPRQK